MLARQTSVRAVQALALAGIVATLGGCAAKVKRTEYNADMARLREEIATKDQQLAQQLGSRVDSTNQSLASTSQTVADHSRRLDALDQEFKAFRDEYKVSIEKIKDQLKFDVPVHFDFAKAEVRDSDKAVLDRFASVVKTYYPGAIITVEGFTDPAGSAAYNHRLGMKRAEAVKAYLAGTDSLGGTIRSVSYGEAKNRQAAPGQAGPGDKGIQNRRVVLVIDHEAIATDKVALR